MSRRVGRLTADAPPGYFFNYKRRKGVKGDVEGRSWIKQIDAISRRLDLRKLEMHLERLFGFAGQTG
jgi:hypothetical protein